MSKNTANIAQAVSLLSDVLSRDARELDENNDVLDDLKEQALEFGQEVTDELDVISDDMDRALELGDYDDDDDEDNWSEQAEWEQDDTAGSISEDDDEDDDAADAADDADDDAEMPSSDPTSVDDLCHKEKDSNQEAFAALEKKNEELTEKVDDLTEVLRHVDTLVEGLNTSAKEFVSEVETL